MKQFGWKANVKYAVWVTGLLASTAVFAHSDDVGGAVERVDSKARTFAIQGQTIHVDAWTKYDDGLTRFEDIRVGDRLEVDIHEKDGKRVAHDIDREDS